MKLVGIYQIVGGNCCPILRGRNKFGISRVLRNICNFLRKYKVSYTRKLQSKKRSFFILMDVMVTGNLETRCLARLLTLDPNVQYECRLLVNRNESCIYELTFILRRFRTGTVWFYTSTSNKRAARPKLYTKSLTRDLKRMYSRLTLVRISIKL